MSRINKIVLSLLFFLSLIVGVPAFASTPLVDPSGTTNPFTDPNGFNNAGTDADKLNDFDNNGTDTLTQEQKNGYTSNSVTGENIATPLSCNTTLDTFGDFLGFGTCLINRFLLPLLITLSLVLFLWGVIQYVLNADNTEERAAGRRFMLWGVFALFILVSIWGLIKLLSATFGFGVSSIIPQFK